MGTRTRICLALAWAAGCGTEPAFCPSERVVCEGASCGDAGTAETRDCVTFDEAAELAAAGGHGILKLVTSVDPIHYGFITATSLDGRSTCREGQCFMLSDAAIRLWTVGETQTEFLGWTGCTADADGYVRLTAKDQDITCVAHYTSAWVAIHASSSGWSGAPIHVTSTSGCDGIDGCNARYGDDVTLTAPSSPDYSFAGWSGCSASTEPVLTLSHVTSAPPTCVAQYRPASP